MYFFSSRKNLTSVLELKWIVFTQKWKVLHLHYLARCWRCLILPLWRWWNISCGRMSWIHLCLPRIKWIKIVFWWNRIAVVDLASGLRVKFKLAAVKLLSIVYKFDACFEWNYHYVISCVVPKQINIRNIWHFIYA